LVISLTAYIVAIDPQLAVRGVLVYVNRKYYACTWLVDLEKNGKELLWLLRLKPTSISRHLVFTAIIGEHYSLGLSAVDALEGNM
jgi:hypothetical protein